MAFSTALAQVVSSHGQKFLWSQRRIANSPRKAALEQVLELHGQPNVYKPIDVGLLHCSDMLMGGGHGKQFFVDIAEVMVHSTHKAELILSNERQYQTQKSSEQILLSNDSDSIDNHRDDILLDFHTLRWSKNLFFCVGETKFTK